MTLPEAIRDVLARASQQNRPVVEGRVTGLLGIAVEVVGLRAAIGDLCTIQTPSGVSTPAEVVGFQGERTMVMPLGEPNGIGPGARVTHHARPLCVTTGDALLGRVLDALGRPVDGGPPLVGPDRPVTNDPPAALARSPIVEPIETGFSAIDGLLTCGKGQRVGIFAGSGVGKSTLLGGIARGSSAQVNVIALIGERGREVGDFLREVLGEEGMRKSVVVVATSDAPAMLRFKGAYTAVTIAESFRERGLDVLLMMDSVTRFAGAVREIGLAVGEPPTLRGYPPSLFSHLPRLVERLGTDGNGSITGMLTVLVDGDDMNEPVADAVRGYLDGHLVLSRAIAARGKFPSIDVLASVSRLMPRVAPAAHLEAARVVRGLLAHHEENRDLVQVGAYRRGADPLLDKSLQRIKGIEELLFQGAQRRSMKDTQRMLFELAGG